MLSYHLVPKDLKQNALWRCELIDSCAADAHFRAEVKEACDRDILFWINAFLWTYDPRRVEIDSQDQRGRRRVLDSNDMHVPWVTWECQDRCLEILEANLGRRDIGIEKSRDMGASWLCLAIFLHQWQFRRGRAFMVVSRNERLVDAQEDPDSLFWKLEYMLKCQPSFLLPRYNRTKLHLNNQDLGSSIDGASTTGDVGRGGRRTAFLLDEYGAFDVGDGYAANAATGPNTNCRIFNSTYKSSVGAFYDQMQREDIAKCRLHWTDHPDKSKGAFRDSQGKWQSPWYIQECARIVVPALIAMELDIDPQGASSMFFPVELIERLIENVAQPPIMIGRLKFNENNPGDPEKLRFFDNEPQGDLWLWMPLAADKGDLGPRPDVMDEFVIGADISTGTGATNSVLSVANKRTREKVAEVARTDLSPDKFADLALAVCAFFNQAFLIWENNGVGLTFGKRIVDSGYRKVYFRKDEQALMGKVHKNLIPGWYANPASRMLLFREYVRCLNNGSFVNRSRLALNECRQYVYLPNGSVGNSKAIAVSDPSGARENHGDRPTADALANKALGDEPSVLGPQDAILQIPENPPEFSLAYRRKKEREQQQARDSHGWETDQRQMRPWAEPLEAMQGW